MYNELHSRLLIRVLKKQNSWSLSANQKHNKEVGDLSSLEMKQFEWFLGTQQ